MGLFSKFKWYRVGAYPDTRYRWEFYPFAVKEGGVYGVDEWHFTEPCWAEPYSHWIADTIGTNDMACVLALIRASREAYAAWIGAGLKDETSRQACVKLREALVPFEKARTVPESP